MAYHALKDAGEDDPEVVKAYGLGVLPDALNVTSGRREVERLTGNMWVPVLVKDDGSFIQGSKAIVAWAEANPARQHAPAMRWRPVGRGDRRHARPGPPRPDHRGSRTLGGARSHVARGRGLGWSAVVELCTCYGEPVDMLASQAPEVIAFVRARPHD